MLSIARRSARLVPMRPVSRLPSLAAVVKTIALWRERARSRRLLLTLDAHGLRDIGIDRMTAETEANTRFWRHR